MRRFGNRCGAAFARGLALGVVRRVLLMLLAVLALPCAAGPAFAQDWSESATLLEADRLVTTLSYLKGLDERSEKRIVAFFHDPTVPGARDDAEALVDAFEALVNDASRKARLTNRATAFAAVAEPTADACERSMIERNVSVAVLLPSVGDAAWQGILRAAERRHVVTATLSRDGTRRVGPSFGVFRVGGRLQTWCDDARVKLEGALNAAGIPWVFRGAELVKRPTGGSEGGGVP
jgi:hypothetical protein